MTTRQYARLVSSWVATIDLDPDFFGTHSLRRTKATLIYRRTRQHRVAIPAMCALLAVLCRLAGGILLVHGENPIHRPRYNGEALPARGVGGEKAPVIEAALGVGPEHCPNDFVFFQQHGDSLGFVDA